MSCPKICLQRLDLLRCFRLNTTWKSANHRVHAHSPPSFSFISQPLLVFEAQLIERSELFRARFLCCVSEACAWWRGGTYERWRWLNYTLTNNQTKHNLTSFAALAAACFHFAAVACPPAALAAFLFIHFNIRL